MSISDVSSARQLIEQAPDFFESSPDVQEKWRSVRQQAAAHMLRENVTHLYDIHRPNEPEEVRDYRQNVHRDITSEGTWKFISKVTRIFLDNGISPDRSQMSEALSEWLNQPFFVDGVKTFDVQSFMYKVLLPFMIEDPNAFMVAFPYNPRDPGLAPALPVEEGGLNPLDRVEVENRLVASIDIVYISDNVLAYRAGEMEYKKGATAPYFFIVDSYEFILYYPIDIGRGMKYVADLWYFHGIGTPPVEQLGGILTRYEAQPHAGYKAIYYYESFLRPYFNYADEFVTSFSDNQAIRIQHAYPKVIMGQVRCTAAGCENGRVRVRDPESGKVVSTSICADCNGTGFVTNPGPYSVLVRDNVPGVENRGPLLEYVTPPGDILQFSYEVSKDLLHLGKKSIGLDLLENVTESGVAKSMRLDDLRDFLWQVASNITRLMQNHLWSVEMLLNITPEEQVEPKVYLPQVIHFTNRSFLKQEAVESLLADRAESQLTYLQQKYRDNVVRYEIYRLAFKLAPLLLMNEQETAQALAVGAYDATDVIRRDRAVEVLSEMADVLGTTQFLSIGEATILETADLILMQYAPAQANDFFDIPFSGDIDAESEVENEVEELI